MSVKQYLSPKNVNAAALYNMLGPILVNGVQFFTLPIFTRILGTTSYGIVAIFTTWVSVITIIIGLQTQGSIGTAFVFFQKEEHPRYLSSILGLSVMSFGVVLLLTIAAVNPISRLVGLSSAFVFLLLLHAFGMFGVNFSTTYFTFSKQAHKTFLLSCVVTLSSVALSLFLVMRTSQEDKLYQGRILGMAIPYFLIGTLAIAGFIFRGKLLYSRQYWRFCLPVCVPLIFHTLSHIVLAQSDRVMLQRMNGNDVAGIYSLGFTFCQILSIIYSALNNTWVPLYYEDLKENRRESLAKKSKNYFFLFTCLTIGFLLVSPEVLKLFSSKEFWTAEQLIPWLTVSTYFTFLYSFPVNFELYNRKTVTVAIGTIVSAAINIVLNYYWIQAYSMLGAAVASLISHILLFLFHHLIALRLPGDYPYRLKDFLPGLLAICCFIAVFYLASGAWLTRWILAFAVGFLLIIKILKNRTIF